MDTQIQMQMQMQNDNPIKFINTVPADLYCNSDISYSTENYIRETGANRRIDSGINNRAETNDNPHDSIPSVIFRFKFTEDFMDELYKFSKIHQYDTRQDFKEAWNIWAEDNTDIINEEKKRLSQLGYDGDVLDKMFKSARYYFRKKNTGNPEPKQRRKYISVSKELLDTMDDHIVKNIYDKTYQPKTGFAKFCKDNETLLRETITQIFGQGIKESGTIEDKIKKTYKNRYYTLTAKKL